jgi:hypothetical protein
MDCRTVRLLLPFARPGGVEMDVGEQHALQRHLADCSACRREWSAQRRVDGVLARAMRSITVPAHLKDRLIARLHLERRRIHLRWLSSGLTAAAAALCIGLFVYHFWPPRNEHIVETFPDIPEREGPQHEPADVIHHFHTLGYPIKLPRELVRDWDFHLLTWAEPTFYDGKSVPTLYFKKAALGARVHILRRDQMDIAALTALRNADDPLRKIIGDPEADEFIAVVVLTGGATFDDFARTAVRIA